MFRFLRVLGVACLFTIKPASAHAQLDRFVQAVRELASASTQTQPARSSGIRAAADNMSASLAEWDRLIAVLEQRVRKAADIDAYQLRVQLAVTYRARGRTADALRELDAGAALRPSSSDLQVLRALTFERLGGLDDARRAFRAAWMLDPTDPVKAYYVVERPGAVSAEERSRARSQLVDAYNRMRTATARPSMPPFVMLDAIPDTLTRAPAVGDIASAEAFALLAAGKFDDGANALRREGRAANGAGDSPATHFARAQEDEARNRVSEARHEYQAALRGALTGRSAIFVAIGRLAQVEGNLAQAIDAFREAVRISPNDPNLHKELASAYVADSRTDDALCELIAAVLIDPMEAQAHAAVGQLYIDTGRYPDAVAALNRALELKPAAFEIRYALATALIRAGNASEGARQMELFERARRAADEQRRRDIADEVERAERPRVR